jgi:serine protease inhibitor
MSNYALRASIAIVLLTQCALSASAQIVPVPPVPPPGVTAIVDSYNRFGFNLVKSLESTSPSDANVFISPVSLSEALGLLYIGASGTTKTEIGNALHIAPSDPPGSKGPDDFLSNNQALLASLLSADPDEQLTIANAVWSQIGRPFKPSYLSQATTFFSATPKSVDFSLGSMAASTINNWVSGRTMGKITQLVSPESVRDASMVLTNAVYFKADWTNSFDPRYTTPEPFTLSDGTVLQIPTMHQMEEIGVYQDSAVTAITLPYRGTPSISLVIVLPATGVSANQLLQSTDTTLLNRWIAGTNPTSVNLSLPKFHIDYSADMSDAVKSLGIKTAFTRDANFEPMGTGNSYVSDVVHKTTVDVDEQGTVAAAATGIVMHSLALRISEVIKIDHPFLCAIRDDSSGALLFLGTINHPQ